jgi:hypothetical protein
VKLLGSPADGPAGGRCAAPSPPRTAAPATGPWSSCSSTAAPSRTTTTSTSPASRTTASSCSRCSPTCPTFARSPNRHSQPRSATATQKASGRSSRPEPTTLGATATTTARRRRSSGQQSVPAAAPSSSSCSSSTRPTPTPPGPDGRTPYQLAAAAGRTDLTELVQQHGATDSATGIDRFLSACRRADRAQAQRQLDNDPGLVKTPRRQTRRHRPRSRGRRHRRRHPDARPRLPARDARPPSAAASARGATRIQTGWKLSMLCSRPAPPPTSSHSQPTTPSRPASRSQRSSAPAPIVR